MITHVSPWCMCSILVTYEELLRDGGQLPTGQSLATVLRPSLLARFPPLHTANSPVARDPDRQMIQLVHAGHLHWGGAARTADCAV